LGEFFIFYFSFFYCDYDFQTLNIIYLDAPVGAGFSYSESQEGYEMDDYKYVAQVYEFLQKVRDKMEKYIRDSLRSSRCLAFQTYKFVLTNFKFYIYAVAERTLSVSEQSIICRRRVLRWQACSDDCATDSDR
jgi:hypothetical protein